MDPLEFLRVALALSVRATQAERRTAVSRAYYASFHWALNIVEAKFGVIVPLHEAHVKLAQCLQSVGDVELAREAGRLLDTLRKARRIADYELQHPSPAQPAWATHCIRQTQAFIDALTTCSREPLLAAVAQGVRNHARDLLGWRLRN